MLMLNAPQLMSQVGRLVGALSIMLLAAKMTCAADTSMSGDYICKALCRPSDAPPGIAIHGGIALCMSELGGIYQGRVQAPNSVSGFEKVGTLSTDGTTLVWSDGVVWARRPSR